MPPTGHPAPRRSRRCNRWPGRPPPPRRAPPGSTRPRRRTAPRRSTRRGVPSPAASCQRGMVHIGRDPAAGGPGVALLAQEVPARPGSRSRPPRRPSSRGQRRCRPPRSRRAGWPGRPRPSRASVFRSAGCGRTSSPRSPSPRRPPPRVWPWAAISAKITASTGGRCRPVWACSPARTGPSSCSPPGPRRRWRSGRRVSTGSGSGVVVGVRALVDAGCRAPGARAETSSMSSAASPLPAPGAGARRPPRPSAPGWRTP